MGFQGLRHAPGSVPAGSEGFGPDLYQLSALGRVLGCHEITGGQSGFCDPSQSARAAGGLAEGTVWMVP